MSPRKRLRRMRSAFSETLNTWWQQVVGQLLLWLPHSSRQLLNTTHNICGLFGGCSGWGVVSGECCVVLVDKQVCIEVQSCVSVLHTSVVGLVGKCESHYFAVCFRFVRIGSVCRCLSDFLLYLWQHKPFSVGKQSWRQAFHLKCLNVVSITHAMRTRCGHRQCPHHVRIACDVDICMSRSCPHRMRCGHG